MPRLEIAEQLTPESEYRFIRLEDRFGFEKIFRYVRREHNNLARSTKLFEGRTPDGKFIVTDGGRMIAFDGYVELMPDWTGSTQVKAIAGFNWHQPNAEEAYDGIRFAVRTETAQKLADFLHRPVIMKYQSAVAGSPIQEFTFTPR